MDQIYTCIYTLCILYLDTEFSCMIFLLIYFQDLFFKYPWNNFLHSQVEGCIHAAVTSTAGLAVVAQGDDGNTESSENSDDSFSLKYHVSC